MSESQASPLTGGCLCGAVRYEAAVERPMAAHCYCGDCRRVSGTGHSTHVIVPETGLSLSGTVATYERPADSGNVVSRHFCPTCGTPIYSTNSGMAGMAFLRASSLDDPDAITPQAQVFTSRAPKWEYINPNLPAFPEMPSEAERKAMTGQN